MGKEMRGSLNMLSTDKVKTYKGFGTKLAAVSLVALALAGCADRATKSQGHLLGAYPRANHPIVVSKKLITHAIPVSRSDFNLGHSHYSGLKTFVRAYRDQGKGVLKVKAPTGTPNETAAFNVMTTVREIITNAGIPEEAVMFTPYSGGNDPEAPIMLEYVGYQATPSPCGDWSKDLNSSPKNMPYPDLGCSFQNNMAVMIANPKDLVEARDLGEADSDRRDIRINKYIKGSDTTSKDSSKQKKSNVK